MLGALALDDIGRRTAIYLLDVSGHGVGASLLSVAVGNILRSRSLPGVDFAKPAEVLTALNESFPLERTDGKFFTAWYGVYDAADRSLSYASAGHHPAILVAPAQATQQLGGTGPLVGFFPDASFDEAKVTVAPRSVVYVFSDGGFEVTGTDGALLGYDAFAEILTAIACDPTTAPPASAETRLEAIAAKVLDFAEGVLDDDFGLLEAVFP